MNTTAPHYLAYLRSGQQGIHGRWGFALCRSDGAERIEASDVEPKATGSRLDLLALVRALESLDQPSRITIVGLRPEIEHGIRYGLAEWRENGWQWEWFGKMVPVRNHDLWQRVDRALRFHQVDAARWRVDRPYGLSDSARSNCSDTALCERGCEPGEIGGTPTDAGAAETAGETAWGFRVFLINWLIYVDSIARRWSRRLAMRFAARRYAGAY